MVPLLVALLFAGNADVSSASSVSSVASSYCFLYSAFCFLPSAYYSPSRKQNFLMQVRGRIARDADVIHVFNSNPSFAQTIANRFCGKAGAMLYAVESFLVCGGD